MGLAPVRTIAPVAQPVTWAEADLHLRLSGDTTDQTLVEGLIEAATAHLDGYTGLLGRALMPQTWRQDFGCFAPRLGLPLAPVASISSVTYFDADNVSQTLATSVYQLLVDARGPYIALKPDQVWPGTYDRADAVSVTFVAGYADADTVPRPIRQAILLYVGAWYENREDTAIGVSVTSLPESVSARALIAPYRRIGL